MDEIMSKKKIISKFKSFTFFFIIFYNLLLGVHGI